MLIKIGFDISFELKGPTPIVAMLYVHPSRQKDLRAEEKLRVTPEVADHGLRGRVRESLRASARAWSRRWFN